MASQSEYVLSRYFEKYGGRLQFSLEAEHSYCRFDWNCSSTTLPTLYLFMSEKCRHFPTPKSNQDDSNDIIKVDDDNDSGDVDVTAPVTYDMEKANGAMNECEKFVDFAEIDGDTTDEEGDNPYSENTWCSQQKKLYKDVLKILKSDRLARLAYEKAPNEPILRRITLNKSTSKIRMVLSSVGWDPSITSKLHMNLVASLSRPLLVVYLDLLQTLMSRVPKSVEQMMRTHMSRLNITANEALDLLLGTPWNPVYNHISQQPLTIDPSIPRPVFIIIRDCPSQREDNGANNRRKFLTKQLSSIGTVYETLNLECLSDHSEDMEQLVGLCLKKIVRKVVEVKFSNPSSPIILIGRSYTSLLACEASSIEKVHAVVCLGFPIVGQSQEAADASNHSGKGSTPTLFIIGQMSSECPIERLESYRASMKAITGLVVVGGSDDYLRMNHSQQLNEEVVQVMVDRCILEKIADFLGHTLKKPKGNEAKQIHY